MIDLAVVGSKLRDVLKLASIKPADLQRTPPKTPAIQQVSNDISSITRAIGQIKQVVELREGQSGSPLDKAVTLRDLFSFGLTNIVADGQTFTCTPTGNVLPNTPASNMTVPPAPTGLTATGAIGNIILSWNDAPYGNHSYTEIWRSATNDIGTAVLNGTTGASVFADSIGAGATYYYWIRFVSTAGIAGPFNAQAGVAASTGQNAKYLIDVLSANPPDTSYNQFLYVQNTPTTINGVPVPAGTYMSTAYIANGSISNAMIGSAAIDSAKIADAAIVTAKIADANITGAKIANATITNANITDATITGAKIANATIDNANVKDATITGAKIANATIGSANIVDAAITNAKIANSTIDIAKINKATIANLAALSATIGTLRTADSGGRLEISDNVIKVFDGFGTLRVKIGNLDL